MWLFTSGEYKSVTKVPETANRRTSFKRGSLHLVNLSWVDKFKGFSRSFTLLLCSLLLEYAIKKIDLMSECLYLDVIASFTACQIYQ